jgi:tetratricopeptide (TPR) repeat protein
MTEIMLCIALNLSLVSTLFAQGHKQVREGNELYSQEKYDEANNKYRDALIDNPESPIVHFNIGDVLYKKKNYEDAVKSFDKTTSSDDVLLQSKSYYNMGNTLYRLNKLPESIQMYKKALELNPDDEDAKYNLEYVRTKIKNDAEKQQQQNQPQSGEQQQEQQSEQNKDEDEQQEQQQEEPKPENGEQDQQQQQQEQQSGEAQEISKEDAERILDALKNEEEDLLQKQKAKTQGRPFRGKDW